ncbi:MAG: branched-chain amino acid ABC transporter permease [Bdellovibrionota bacterium]
MTDLDVFLQQLLNGLSNGMIIALIAIGYTLVYGIIELINFAHGDLVMLGCFFALTLVEKLGLTADAAGGFPFYRHLALMFLLVAVFCGLLNWLIDYLAYRPLRESPRLAQLVTAIGISFIFVNFGLFWGGMPLKVFNNGVAAAAPKDFPALISADNLLGDSVIQFGMKDVMVFAVTVPLLILLTLFVKYTKWGTAMRAVAQSPIAAKLMGIDVDKVIGSTFIIGGALGGVGGVIYALYNNTIYFQMGYRIGMDGFVAAVLGGIGNLPGAMLGGLVIGLVRAMSDQYIATRWTSVIVYAILILVLVFRPSGLLGARVREKV